MLVNRPRMAAATTTTMVETRVSGQVGQVTWVNAPLLQALCEADFIPVIAPIARDAAGDLGGQVGGEIAAQEQLLEMRFHLVEWHVEAGAGRAHDDIVGRQIGAEALQPHRQRRGAGARGHRVLSRPGGDRPRVSFRLLP